LIGAAYLLAASALPEASAEVAAAAGAVAVSLCALALLPGRDDPVALGVLAVGALVLAVALNGRDAVTGATPVEALFGAAAGLLFAYGFAAPAAVITVPLLVAGVDAATLLFGPADTVADRELGADLLTLVLPGWGDEPDGPALALLDATFLGLLAAWSVHFALRPRLTVPLMVVALAAAATISVAVDRALPTLPFLAAAFLAGAATRLPALLRSEG
jgi:hypothetical protein